MECQCHAAYYKSCMILSCHELIASQQSCPPTSSIQRITRPFQGSAKPAHLICTVASQKNRDTFWSSGTGIYEERCGGVFCHAGSILKSAQPFCGFTQKRDGKIQFQYNRFFLLILTTKFPNNQQKTSKSDFLGTGRNKISEQYCAKK